MNVTRLTIGLTGGIASGKTAVAQILESQGVPVIDADNVARELVEPGRPALAEIISTFGANVLDNAGRLDRAALRQRVFSAPADRQRLEDILHPCIRQEMHRRSIAAVGPYCVLAIPLLLEKDRKNATVDNEQKGTDSQNAPHPETLWQIYRILVVDATVEQQIMRACQRDNSSPDTIKAIIRSQVGRDRRLAAAHDVITNDGDLEHLRRQVLVLHHRYLRMVN